MTKRDYELIAGILRATVTDSDHDYVRMRHRQLAEQFAAEFAKTNPRFNRATFLAACGAIPKPRTPYRGMNR